jgi:hypothetical protein
MKESDETRELHTAVRDMLDWLAEHKHIRYGSSDWGRRKKAFIAAYDKSGTDEAGLNAALEGLPDHVKMRAKATFFKKHKSPDDGFFKRFTSNVTDSFSKTAAATR